MNIIPNLVLVVAISALTGCAASAYKPPTQGPSARLRIVDSQVGWRGNLKTMIYPSGQCDAPGSLGMVGGIGRLGTPATLGMPDNPGIDPKDALERVIPAGHPILLTFFLNSMDGTCITTGRLTPREDANYQVDVKLSAIGCSIKIAAIGVSKGEIFELSKDGLQQAPLCTKGF